MMSGEVARPAVAAVVLAAGLSRRMDGENKLLAEIDGVPMIARVVDALMDAPVVEIVVVTGHLRAWVEQALAGQPVRFVHNPAYARGMSTSLRAGIRALLPDTDGALVCLGDMPGVRADHVEALVAAFDPAAGRAICVPVHQGTRGHPVLFGARLFEEMGAIAGDVGARAVIQAHADLVHEVPVGDSGILVDVDTAAALAAVRAGADVIHDRKP
jgi:molybdenum cofactor cytidylyltransferase